MYAMLKFQKQKQIFYHTEIQIIIFIVNNV